MARTCALLHGIASNSEGAGRFTLAFTGVEVLDALNLVDGRLTLNQAFR